MNLICGLANFVWLYIYWNSNSDMVWKDHLYGIQDVECMSLYSIMPKLFYNIIPLIVFFNGILHHVCCSNVYTKWYDIVMNIIMICFINLYTKETVITITITSLVAGVFYCNQYINSNLIHVCFVNWPLVYLYLICA